jgi:hypothetical protein
MPRRVVLSDLPDYSAGLQGPAARVEPAVLAIDEKHALGRNPALQFRLEAFT